MTTSINQIEEHDSPVIRALAAYFSRKREERELLDKAENASSCNAGQNDQEVTSDSI